MDDLVPGYEPASGQLILDARPAGPAGEAGLVPVPGVDLAFDRADGRIVRVIADVGAASAAQFFTWLFGSPALLAVRDATGAPASPDARLCSALSSLARLDAAQVTSPGAGDSPWWAAEAAVLAEKAGLHGRAVIEARRAIRALSCGRVAVTGEAASLAEEAAAIAAEADPDAPRRLRESLAAATPPRPGYPGLDVAAEVAEMEQGAGSVGPHPLLDLGLARSRGLRPGLTPRSDLVISSKGEGRLKVQATLTPGSDRLARCPAHARLVDPGVRRVLARADLQRKGNFARALLTLPFPLDELGDAWIEVSEPGERPVASARAHCVQRALRWADAALRAERAPAGLAPQATAEDWAALAALSWERCRRDWEAAGDPVRAAAARAPQSSPTGPTYLAEVLEVWPGRLLDDHHAAGG